MIVKECYTIGEQLLNDWSTIDNRFFKNC